MNDKESKQESPDSQPFVRAGLEEENYPQEIYICWECSIGPCTHQEPECSNERARWYRFIKPDYEGQCNWRRDEDNWGHVWYDTACGEGFMFLNDDPDKNFKYCPYCSKEIRFEQWGNRTVEQNDRLEGE